MVLVDANYVRPLRCGFDILNRQEDTTYYTYDPFVTTNNLNVQSIALNLSEGGNGTASITLFDDGQGAFDIKNGMIRGSVILRYGKTQSELTDILHCYNPILRTSRPDTNLMYRTIECTGKVVMLDERLVTFVRHAAYKLIDDSTHFVRSDKMQAYKLVTELFSKEKIMPLGSYQNSLQEHGSYLLNGISSKVNDFIAAIDFELATGRTVLDTLAGLAGATWRIDQNNSVVFEYPREQHTGILITDNPCDPTAKGWESFPVGAWNWWDDATAGTGFATDIIGKMDNPFDFSDSASNVTNQRVALFEHDIAQQFTITTPDFSEICLILSKEGDPDDDVHFHIVQDNAGQPTGKKIAEGNIDIDSIPEDPTPIYISKLRFSKKPQVGAKAWLILYRVKGDDNDNTVHWYHDDGSTGTSSQRDIVADPDDDHQIDLKHPNHTTNAGWTTTTGTGVQFSYSIFDFLNYATIAYDPRAAEKFGWVDKFVDLSFTSHLQTAMLVLHAFLEESSKVLRNYNIPATTVPDLPYQFYPEQLVTLHDNLSGFTPQNNNIFKIDTVGYLFSALGDTQTVATGAPLGTRTCAITGTNRIDYHFDDVNDETW